MAARNDRESLAVRALAGAGILLLHLSIRLLNALGYPRTLALAEIAGDTAFIVFRRLKARIRHNLGFAFGDQLSEDAKEKLIRNIVRNICKNWFEAFFYAGPAKDVVAGAITFQGLEHLEQALARGRGVIAVSAHIGNYPLLGQQFGRQGHVFEMVIRDPGSRAASKIYTHGRDLIGLTAFFTKPERAFFKRALKVLRANGIVGLISDENKRRGGIFVDFFGHPASTPPGAAALAVRTGAAVLPVFIVRNDDNSQKIIIEPEVTWQPTDDSSADMARITAQFTQVIEETIRRDPAQWTWTNWRWRTQPWGKSSEAKIEKTKRLKKLKRDIKGRI